MMKETILEQLFSYRVNTALEHTLTMDKEYQKTVKNEDELFNRLEKTYFSKKQKLKVDRVISASNACGAAYGRTAYRQGFQDALKLIAELAELA